MDIFANFPKFKMHVVQAYVMNVCVCIVEPPRTGRPMLPPPTDTGVYHIISSSSLRRKTSISLAVKTEDD